MKKLDWLSVFTLLLLAAQPSFAQNDPSGGVQLTSASGTAAATFKAALWLHDIGEPKKAREALLKAVSQDPNLSIAYLYLANHATSPQEFVSFLNSAKAGLAAANEWEKLYYDYMETERTNDLDKRLALAQKMVTGFPRSARSHLLLGETYVARNEVMAARESLEQAIAIDPSWPGAYTALINTYLFQEPKDFEKAQQKAETFVRMAPSANNAHIMLGDAYRAQNNLAKAEAAYSRVVAMDATQAGVFYKRGHINTFLGNYEKARSDYAKAGQLDVQPTLANSFIAFTYLYQGQPLKAIQALQKFSLAAAGNADKAKAAAARYNYQVQVAEIAAHTGNVSTLQQTVVQLTPLAEELARQVGTDEARRNYQTAVLFYEGLLKTLNKDFAGARQAAENIRTTLSPINDPRKDEDYHFLLGYTSLHEKDYPNAIMHLEALNNADVYARYCLARAYDGNGASDKARTIDKELVNYNFNEVGYALIRNELKKKM